MITSNLSKGFILFLMITATMAVNLDDNLLARPGFEMNFGLVLIAALIVAFLAAEQKMAVIFLLGAFSLIANMPADFALNFGLDRDIFFGLLSSITLAPVIAWFFDL